MVTCKTENYKIIKKERNENQDYAVLQYVAEANLLSVTLTHPITRKIVRDCKHLSKQIRV